MKLVYKILRYSGLPLLFRELLQRNKVTILEFHNMKPENANYAFPWLKTHYNIIGLQDYLDAVQSGKKLPKKAVIATFDDGHKGNYELLPIIKRLQIPVTIFLCSDIVGTHRHFWFLQSKAMFPERHQGLKELPNHLRLERLAESYGFEQTQEFDDVHALSREQIEEMKPFVDFQSHTCFHPCLPQCDDKTSFDEISLSKQHLERDYDLHINAISYPNGDYTDREVRFLQEAGYTCGVTVDHGYNDLHSDLFRLKRISVNDARSLDELVVKSSGLYAFLLQK